MALSNGDLVQVTGSPEIYLVILGQYCGIPDEPTASSLFGPNWPNYVTQVSALLDFPTGPMFTSGACVVQATGEEAIYLYSWGVKFLIANPQIQVQYHFNNSVLSGLSQELIAAMPAGFTITS